MNNVKVLKCNTDGSIIEKTGIVEENDYVVLKRIWTNNTKEIMREWTCDEYIRSNPNDRILIQEYAGEYFVEAELHCVEYRKIFVRNKNGVKLSSFISCFDYSKDNKK